MITKEKKRNPVELKSLGWLDSLSLWSLIMDQVQHKFVDVGGLKLHVAEIGTGQKPTLIQSNLFKNQTQTPFDHSLLNFENFLRS